MLIGDLRPTTLEGIKSLATQISKEQGIKHALALDLASKAANYTNFRNAQRALRAQESAIAGPYVLLTMYWRDKDRHRRGRETLTIEISKSIHGICGKSALKNVRGFGDLRMVADDHFVCDTLAPTQTSARERLCRAERSLRFMEHTGLRPPRNFREAHPKASVHQTLPSKDHSTVWIDPASGQFILVDEPYGGAPDEEGRAVWADRNGWRIIKTTWPGMYSPYACDLYIATAGQPNDDFDALVGKINAMPAPLISEDWPGESSPSWETFASPMAKTTQDIRRARCRGTIVPVPSSTTVPYSYDFGSSPRRPAAKMGAEGHIEVGRILKAILHSNQCPYWAYSRLNSVRSTLEDWMNLEIDRNQLEGPEFFDVYYAEAEGDTLYREMASTRAGAVAMLGELKLKLQTAYPNCAPLRTQLHRIDVSVSLIGKANPAGD